jgi:hypothetical protein
MIDHLILQTKQILYMIYFDLLAAESPMFGVGN